MCMCGYGFVSLFLHVRVLVLVKLWGVILFVCICLPPGLFMALSVCVCVCVCVAYNLCMWECCAFVFVCFLPVATCKDRFCIFFCLGLCLFVSLYFRFHGCFFVVKKVEHLNRSHITFWDHFWCSTQPSGGTTTDGCLLHHHWVFHYHSWYLFQTIIPDLRKIL